MVGADTLEDVGTYDHMMPQFAALDFMFFFSSFLTNGLFCIDSAESKTVPLECVLPEKSCVMLSVRKHCQEPRGSGT